MRKVEYLNVSSSHASIFSLFSGTQSKGRLVGMSGISMGMGHKHGGDSSGFAVSSLFICAALLRFLRWEGHSTDSREISTDDA